MIAYGNMAAFFESQLDFIFFLYGLAFILLGAVCFAISKVPGRKNRWGMLGIFALLHGFGEWLDLTALVIGDTPTFAAIRVVLMTCSFVLLMEFARLSSGEFNHAAPGRWIYLPLVGIVGFGAWWGGLGAAGALGRYIFGFLGAAGTGLIFVGHAQRLSGEARKLAVFAASCFFLYAVAAGIIVPKAPMWPASVVHHAWFMELTGVPIQLIRGALACALALSIWAIWGNLLASELGSERYTAYLHKQFIRTTAALAAIILVGWTLTEFLGGTYRHNVEQNARGDIDLLASRLAGETAIADGMVLALAHTPGLISLEGGDRQQDRNKSAQAPLELHVEAAGARAGYILDATGEIIAASEEIQSGATDALLKRLKPLFDAAMAGKSAHQFAVGADGSDRGYDTSLPIRGNDGTFAGVAILSKSLDGFEDDLSHFRRPYFLIDQDGVVITTNRRGILFKRLWPQPTDRKNELAQHYQSSGDRPMVAAELTGGQWASFDGKREYVLRRSVQHSRWSLVIAMPTETIFASRLIGIVVTLLVTIMALIYFVGREHGIRESVQMEQRRALQKLAHDLRFQAITDPLTGLFNRWKFDDTLANEMTRSARYGTPLSLMLYDVDHFKEVNDIHGHQAGDDVLVRMSQVVAGAIRKSDLLARWGGEEFVILAPGSNGPKAYQVASKLSASIAQIAFVDVGRVTCSFGVAEYVEGDTAESLMARADGALYRAKINGRNRVEIAELPGAGSAISMASLRP